MGIVQATLSTAARSKRLQRISERFPPAKKVVRRFVAGRTVEDALTSATELRAKSLNATIDWLGEDVTSVEEANSYVTGYEVLLRSLAEAGLTAAAAEPSTSIARVAEVSVKLSALGQAIDPQLATDNAAKICAAAERAGTTVTLDMEDHTTIDATLETLSKLRPEYPWLGAVLQAALHRTAADAADLATPGSRVRLCKGAYNEPETVALRDRAEVQRNYLECVRILGRGGAYVKLATHDPELIVPSARALAELGISGSDFEYQMLLGVRPDEQARLAAEGSTVRCYVPYGENWYGYLMRRMAERPANLALFLRALVSRK